MAQWVIKGKYKNMRAERLDTASTERQAMVLAGEYAMAYGSDFTIWVEEPRRRGQKQAWRMNPGVMDDYADDDRGLPFMEQMGGKEQYARSVVDELTQELRTIDGKLYWIEVGKPLTWESAEELLPRRFELLRLIDSWGRAAKKNPGYELRHYVVELTATGDTKRWVKIGKRDWTPDWGEAVAAAGEMTEKHPRSAGFEVVSILQGDYEDRSEERYLYERNPMSASVRILDRSLGVRLHQWHYGQDDPIYATGSLVYAGQPVPRELLAETIDSLQTLRRRTKSRAEKAELKDLAVLLTAAGF